MKDAMTANIRRATMLALVVWFGLAASPVWAAVAGQFQFVSGNVRVERAGQTLLAEKGSAVQEGDVIVTGSPGDAQLRMIDSAFIAIKANSRMRVDQYTYRPANAAEDNAVLSLLVGTMRAFTGGLVERNKDRFSMKTAIATVGIRGSGNILNAAADGTTLNYTITGAHSVTSADSQGVMRTLVSRAGQTVQVLPGQAPQYIPTPPFILSVASPPKSAAKSDKSDKSGSDVREKSSADSNVAAAPAATTESVVTTALANSTQQSVQQASTQSFANTLAQSQFSSVSEAAAVGRFSIPVGSGYAGVLFQQSVILDPFTGNVPGSTFDFDLAGNLTSISHGLLSTFINGPGALPPGFSAAQYDDATIAFHGGVAQDNYRDTTNQIVLGRWQGGSVEVAPRDGSASVSFTLGARSVDYVVFRPTNPGILASYTGTTSYVLAGATRPTDSLGNIGVLNSANVNANFTSHVADVGLNYSINNQTINLAGSSLAFVGLGGQFGAILSGPNNPNNTLAISCSGSNCNVSGYNGVINGNFAGANGTGIVIDYRTSTIRAQGQAHDNIMSGHAALTASSQPTVGVVLPLTGTATYTLGGLNALDFQGNTVQFSATAGQLNANFTSRTVDSSISFTTSQSNQTWAASASAAPIHGVGFFAQLGGSAPAGVANLNVSCTGSGCPASTAGLAGRFDGYFTGASAGSATIQYTVGTSTSSVYFGSADFVRSSSGVAAPADPLLTAVLAPRTGGFNGALARIDRVLPFLGYRNSTIR
jgi:hypothetical protein